MRYIAKQKEKPPAQGVQRRFPSKYLQSQGATIKAPTKSEELQKNTHAKDGVSPPIMVTIS